MKIIIIGAGPGGYETAALAASRGIEVVLINDGPLGGTCLNEGCIPTKALCAMDAPDQERKREVIGQLQAGVAQLMRNKLITLVQGKASLKGGCSVEVGGQTFTGDALISFVNKLFTKLKRLDTSDGDMRKFVVRNVFEDINNYMKSGVYLRQLISLLFQLGPLRIRERIPVEPLQHHAPIVLRPAALFLSLQSDAAKQQST